jgi:transposase, IS5 family
MLVDFYEREDVFAPVPKLAQEIDPILRKLDGLLDDDALYHRVRSDFGKRYRSTLVHGRHSTPVEVLLRMLILKHLYQWSYKETEGRVADSLVLRWFCRMAFHEVPDASTLWRWEQTLQPETVHTLNDRVVQLAAQAKATKGRKLRLDATCVQTNIHHPTDSGLMVDSVRVLSRLVQRAKGLLKEQGRNVQQRSRERLRSARRVVQSLHRLLRRKSETKESEQQSLCWLLLISSKKQTNFPLQLPCHVTPESHKSQEREKIVALAARNSCAGKHPSALLVPWSAKNVKKLHSDEHTEALCGFCVSSLQLFGRTYALRR